MCVLGIELHQVRHRDTGATAIVNQADYAVMVDGKPPTGGWLNRCWGPRRQPSTPPPSPAPASPSRPKPTVGDGSPSQMVHDGKTLLTVSQTRAFEIGLSANDPATTSIATTGDIGLYFGASSTFAVKPSPVAVAAYWLNRPWMRAILIVVMLVGGYIELQAPGIGVGGGLGAGRVGPAPGARPTLSGWRSCGTSCCSCSG